MTVADFELWRSHTLAPIGAPTHDADHDLFAGHMSPDVYAELLEPASLRERFLRLYPTLSEAHRQTWMWSRPAGHHGH